MFEKGDTETFVGRLGAENNNCFLEDEEGHRLTIYGVGLQNSKYVGKRFRITIEKLDDPVIAGEDLSAGDLLVMRDGKWYKLKGRQQTY